MTAPKKVMDVPAFFQRQRLTADQTFPILLQPKATRLPASCQGAGHLMRQALFKVQFPGPIVGIGVTLAFHVPADRRGSGTAQKDRVAAAPLGTHGAAEP